MSHHRHPPLSLPGERWRPIPDHPRYEASSLGRIRCIRYVVRHSSMDTFTRLRVVMPHILRESQPVGRRLHPHVHLAEGVYYVHDLVAGAWIGEKPAGQLVLHRDDVGTNNRPGNLRYGTPSENCKDRIRNREIQLARWRATHPRRPKRLRPRRVDWSQFERDPVPTRDPDYCPPF